MPSVAQTAMTVTTSLFDKESAPGTLDAHLVRAMGWVKQGNANLVDTLVANMTAGADTQAQVWVGCSTYMAVMFTKRQAVWPRAIR